MKMRIYKPIDVEVKYIKFQIPIYLEDIDRITETNINNLRDNFNSELSLLNEYDVHNLSATVEIDTGKIINWKELDCDIDIFSKVVDEGKYTIYDENMEEIKSYIGYVPKFFECNENGYGDYFNMTITKDGYIKNFVNEYLEGMDAKLTDFLNKCNDN